MSDFLINVRQIMEYPLKGEASEADAVLLQTGALGGPYAWTTTYGLVTGALNWPGAKLGVGRVVPVDAAAAQVFTDDFIVPVGGGIWFNRYTDFNGMGRYWETGPAGIFGFNAGGGIQFDPFPPGPGGSLTPVGLSVWSVGPDGYMIAADTLLVGRDPTAPLEVATKGYVDRDIDELSDRIQQIINNSVWSFNGRSGNVTLFLSDILSAGGAPVVSPQLMGVPTAPTALPMTATSQIATTAFVREALEEANLIGPPGPPGPQGPQGPAGTGASIGGSPPPVPSLGDLWGDDYWGTLSFWDGTDWIRAPQIRLQDTPAGGGSGELRAAVTGLGGLSETYSVTDLATWFYGDAAPFYDPNDNVADGARGCLWWSPLFGRLRVNVGTGASPVWQSLSAVTAAVVTTFASSGTYTPAAGLLFAVIECVGGGGGGGGVGNSGAAPYAGAAGGGGSGGYSRSILTPSQIGTSQPVIIGLGGPGGFNGSVSGDNGGATSFGDMVIAPGGNGGQGWYNVANNNFGQGGLGSTAGTGQLALHGDPGIFGVTNDTPPPTPGIVFVGGNGGRSLIGAGGRGGASINLGSGTSIGNNGEFGGGGGGSTIVSSGTDTPGGAGGNGICIVTEFLF